jgi:lipopolysaccharide transport system ATP-binding protein
LIVDEVLAVGDLEFQQKCLRQMGEVARDGRTVLFVSHNLSAVQRLCTRSILLDNGRAVADGETAEVVRSYIASGSATPDAARWMDVTGVPRSVEGPATFQAVRYLTPDPALDFRPFPGAPLEIAAQVRATAVVPRATIGFRLRDPLGATLMSGSTNALGLQVSLREGVGSWVFRIASLNLRPGTYDLDLWVGDAARILDQLQPAVRLEVFDRPSSTWAPRFDPRCDGPVFCEYDVRLGEVEARARSCPPSARTS